MSFSFNFNLSAETTTEAASSDRSCVTHTAHTAIPAGSSTVSSFNLEVARPEGDVEQYTYALQQIGDIAFKRPLLRSKANYADGPDIIPGEYEGGYKIWEGSCDLAFFMKTHTELLPPERETSRVIELGCGFGLPGICALNMGYRNVVFSDFNKDVIENSTWPAILLNCNADTAITVSTIPDRDIFSNVRCFYGDWSDLSRQLKQEKLTSSSSLSNSSSASHQLYDLILSSETIYTKENCVKLIQFIDENLSPDGVVLIASKRFYFGVGGGISDLENQLQVRGNAMKICTREVVEDGSSNIREVVVLQREVPRMRGEGTERVL